MNDSWVARICTQCRDNNRMLAASCPYDLGEGDSLTKIPCYALVVLHHIMMYRDEKVRVFRKHGLANDACLNEADYICRRFIEDRK